MTPDIRELIDSAELRVNNQAEIEQTVKFLKGELKQLKFTIKEQKLLIQEQKEKIEKGLDIPEDIEILKDMLLAQRREIKKRDKDFEILEQRIEELKVKKEINKNSEAHEEKNEELINAKKLIIQLTEENEKYQINETNNKSKINELAEFNKKFHLENEILEEKLNELDSNSSIVKTDLKNSIDISSEITALNEKIRDLENERKKLKRNLESANSTSNKLVEEINVHLNEISELNKEIRGKNIKLSALNEKSNSLKRQNIKMQKTIIDPLNREDFSLDEIKDKKPVEMMEYLEKENMNLIKIINELRNSVAESYNHGRLKISNKVEPIEMNGNVEEINTSEKQLINNYRFNQGLPYYYQNILFMRIFSILKHHEKEAVLDSIIEDLNYSKDSNIKRYLISLLIDMLSELKDERVYKLLIKLLQDDDWLIRLYLVKALYKIEISELNKRFKKPLKILLADNDLDVREASEEILSFMRLIP